MCIYAPNSSNSTGLCQEICLLEELELFCVSRQVEEAGLLLIGRLICGVCKLPIEPLVDLVD